MPTQLKKKKSYFRFDDEHVTKATGHDALTDSFGGHMFSNKTNLQSPGRRAAKSWSSAYMLVYVRVADYHKMMRPISEEEIPRHLVTRFKEEEEERLRKMREKREAHMCVLLLLLSSVARQTHHHSQFSTGQNGVA